MTSLHMSVLHCTKEEHESLWEARSLSLGQETALGLREGKDRETSSSSRETIKGKKYGDYKEDEQRESD